MIRTNGQDNGRGNKNSGQTALVLILLTAAALIFYAISLNWGRIAQEKALVTVAANQAAAVLASDAASYGESLKVQWLGNVNSYSATTDVFSSFVMLIIEVVLIIVSFGALAPIMIPMMIMTIVNLVLQVTVVQPSITAMWNSQMLKEQPNYEQFYEQGIQTALAGSITDQVNIADYFDSNANGVLGLDPATGWTTTRDSLGRFAFFYSERLKMLNAKARIPQIQFFYDQLGQFMNGQTCADNLNNIAYAPSVYGKNPNPACNGLDCSSDSLSTTGCQTNIAGAFQLNDPCTDSDITDPLTYNPYCDPCCQPYFGGPDPLYNPKAPTPNNHPYPFIVLRPPLSCTTPGSDACKSDAVSDYNTCASSCSGSTDPRCIPKCLIPYTTILANDSNCLPKSPQCVTNNPYPPCPDGDACPATGLCNDGTACGTTNPYIYDPAFQNYPDQVSFLAQFGRDQQWIPPGGPLPPTTVTPDVIYSNICTNIGNDCTVGTCEGACTAICPDGSGDCALGTCTVPCSKTTGICTTADGSPCPNLEFPNGIYPFFWMMKDYSPQVDNIVSTSLASPAPLYWCAAVPPIAKIPTTSPLYPPVGFFPDLAQLTLPAVAGWAGCSGPSCCVNSLGNSVTTAANVYPNVVIDTVGDPPTTNPALDKIFGDPITFTDKWTEGDNQMCLATTSTWPYNGSTLAVPDGTCEWTNSATVPTGSTAVSTVDQLDDVMHTLSDFVKFADVFLNKDIGQLNSTFHSWYPSVAKWIAPNCADTGGSPFPGAPACIKPCADGSTCDSGGPGLCKNGVRCRGRLLSIYNPYNSPKVDLLSDWEKNISKWLRQDYTGSVNISGVTYSPWCVPLQTDPSMLACPDGTPCLSTGLCDDGTTCVMPTDENTYIASTTNSVCPKDIPTTCPATDKCSDGTPCFFWGRLPQVIACLNYNADHSDDATPFGYVYNFQQCQSDLKASPCPATQPAECSSVMLRRSLTGNPMPAYDGCKGKFRTWVDDSLTLAISQAPKFAKRASFLTDIYSRAQTMKNIFLQGNKAVNTFLKPCSSIEDPSIQPQCADNSMCGIKKNGYCADGTTPCGCQDGGPAAQLMWARDQADPAAGLPNSVIYGWYDRQPIGGGGCMNSNGNRGCGHIVKVTAYSAGRCGGICNSNNKGQPGGTNELDSLLPWINTTTSGFMGMTRTYTLTDRDEFVHVTIQRWDQDHPNVLSFPNGLPLWRFLFHNLSGSLTSLPSECFGLSALPGSSAGGGTGFGLKSETLHALLNYSALESGENVLSQDATALGQAFMLNDNGDGNVDSNAGRGTSYKTCVDNINNYYIPFSMTSDVCAEYVATGPPSSDAATAGGIGGSPSQDDDANYKIIFENCPY